MQSRSFRPPKDNNIAKAAINALWHRKTYCSDSQSSGLDIEFSLKGTEIKIFVRDIKNTYALLGMVLKT